MSEYISKSEKKRQFKQVEKVAGELVELSNTELKKLACSDELKEEILLAKEQKGGARKRQIKYVSKLMRKESLDDIYDFLERKKGSQLKSKQLLHEAERLRDALVNEGMELFQESRREQIPWEPDWESDEIPLLLKKFPELSEGEVRKTVYNYVKSHNKMYYRELFRIIKGAMDKEELRRRSV